MSFFGSTDSLMEGSELRSVLETVYAPFSVGHMFSGKAYSRSLRSNFLSTSALLYQIWKNSGMNLIMMRKMI